MSTSASHCALSSGILCVSLAQNMMNTMTKLETKVVDHLQTHGRICLECWTRSHTQGANRCHAEAYLPLLPSISLSWAESTRKTQCMKPCREKSFIFSKYDFDSHCVQLPTLKMFDCPFVAPEEQEDIQTGAVADKDMEASDRGATKIIKKGELPTSKIKTL